MERAERECAIDCLHLGISSIAEKEFGAAAIHLENAARSLRELERIEVKKNEAEFTVISIGVLSRHHVGE